jgi:hypothetical protein
VGQAARAEVPRTHHLCDNNAGFLALKAGQVDVSQQFNANVQELWLEDNLPISTYMDEAPYGPDRQLPDRLLQPEVLWSGQSCCPQSDCLWLWTMTPSSPTR